MTSVAIPILEEEEPVRKRGRSIHSTVGMLNIVPMLDILFNLLILFLCFGLALAPEGALPAKLPGSHGQAAGTMPLTPIEVRLIGDTGGVHIQMRPQGLQLSNMGDVYAQMRMLVESRDFGADAPVILVPGPDVPMAAVADAYNAAFQAGFKEIVFGDKVDEGNGADGQR